MQTPPTSPLQRSVRAADLPIDQIANNPRLSKDEKLGAACRAFEAVLLRQILESAHKPVIASSFNAESASAAVYRDLITGQMAESVSRSGQIGLAASFLSQLKGRTPATPTTPAATSPVTGAAAAGGSARPTPMPVPTPTATGTPGSGSVSAPAPAAAPAAVRPALKPFQSAPDLKAYRHE